MAALLTLQQAKTHLRITDNDRDDDIYLKAEQASAIVIDYLKSRAHVTAAIASSSVASPTLITTDDIHGFVSGDSVTIVDHEDSTPSLSGPYVVTVVSTTTFTVPVAVTVTGTGGTATVAWTPITVPRLVHAATLLVLEDLHEHRPIDWESQRRLLERSRDPAFA